VRRPALTWAPVFHKNCSIARLPAKQRQAERKVIFSRDVSLHGFVTNGCSLPAFKFPGRPAYGRHPDPACGSPAGSE
jgi:hypothetical protein